MKIVVTGSLGNISRPLVVSLVQKGHSVTVISSKADKQKAIEDMGAKAAIGILEDTDFLTKTFKGADAVYCMLPPYNYMDPQLDYMEKTRQLMENYKSAIVQSGVQHVVHLSSIGAHRDNGIGLLRFHFLAEKILQTLPPSVSVVHVRALGFYTNLYNFINLIKGEGWLGKLLALRFYGLGNMITGKTGIILSNYGGSDITIMVSPLDIAAAIEEELTMPSGRKIRYVASDEMTCDEVAKTLGKAIGKPYLKWAKVSDKQMLKSLQSFHIPPEIAKDMVEMNAAISTKILYEDYYRHKPTQMGKVKMADFAQEFKSAFQKNA